MECSKCEKDLLNKDIGGFISCQRMVKYWCSDCWTLKESYIN